MVRRSSLARKTRSPAGEQTSKTRQSCRSSGPVRSSRSSSDHVSLPASFSKRVAVLRFASCGLGVLLGVNRTVAAMVQDAPRTAVAPVFSDTGPEASDYGAREGFPVGTKLAFTQIPNLVGAFSHFDQLFPARTIPRSKTPWSFRRA